MQKIVSFFKNLFSRKTLNETSAKQPRQKKHFDVGNGVLLRRSHTYGCVVGSGFWTIDVYNTHHPKLGWRTISPKFFTSDTDSGDYQSAFYIDRILFSDEDENRSRKRILLLESLQRNCAANNVDWLFWYVAHVLSEFAGMKVKDENKVEISCVTQVTDMGDEIFDAIYATKKELGLDASSGYMQKFQHSGEGAEALKEVYEMDGTSRFKHIGSSAKNMLEIHWTFNLDDIKLETGINTKQEN